MVFGRKPKDPRPDESAEPTTPVGEASLRDELGMYHLWYLELRLKDELARAARKEGTFSLVCWQLRGLPGESMSDELVNQAAGVISGGLRSYDVFARVDEQRFVALLFDAEQQPASAAAFRIKGDMQVQMQTTGRWQAGVATFPQDGVVGDSLIQAAFRRLAEDSRAVQTSG
jgi:PleD family two-component response regulator